MNTPTRRTCGHFLVGNHVDAVYAPVSDPMYQHNCYIEALPPIMSPDEAVLHMRRTPTYSEKERLLSPLQRLQAVQRVANCIIPLPEYIQLEQKFSRMILNGYHARNPLSAEWRAQLKLAYENLQCKRGEYDYVPLIRSTAAGFCIIGASGVGKTTLVESILSLYPQVIVHTAYNGTPLDQQQLVWLKLDCPFDGSPRGLCTSFFQAIDHLLGTRYAAKYDKGATDFVMPRMALLAGELGLGVLVIDEIQRLNESSGGGANKILDFFVQLTSTIGVPVVMLGTYKASNLFSKTFASGRRVAGQGSVTFGNFAPDDFWDHFIGSIWRYQWTNIPTPLSAPLRKAIYDESQGIADIAVKIYMLAQWQVIGTPDERITTDLIRTVVKESLQTVAPMLQALRNNDLKALSQIEDICPPQDFFDAALTKATGRVMLTGKMATVRNEMRAEECVHEVGSLPHERLALQLIAAGFSDKIAVKCARAACDRFAADTDMKRASAEAFRSAGEEDSNQKEAEAQTVKKEPPAKKKAKVFSLSGDLREVVKNAPAGMTPYEALKEAGVIKSPMEFFPGA